MSSEPTKAMLALGTPKGLIEGGYGWTIVPARYAKGKMALHILNRTGWKQRGERLADHLNMKWTHRENAYIASPKKMSDWMRFLTGGWDASVSLGKLYGPSKLIPPKVIA